MRKLSGRTPTTVRVDPSRISVFPRTSGSEPSRLAHKSWLMTATGAVGSSPTPSSPGRNQRPRTGWIPRTFVRDALPLPMVTREAGPCPVRVASQAVWAPTPSRVFASASRDRNSSRERGILSHIAPDAPGRSLAHSTASQMSTRRPGSRKGTLLRRTPSTTLNIAVAEPMPRPRVSTATRLNLHRRRSVRAANRRSCQTDPGNPLPECGPDSSPLSENPRSIERNQRKLAPSFIASHRYQSR